MSVNRKNIFTAFALGLASFIVYIFTAYPAIHTGDSGEIASAVYFWGVAHPTGFPAYIISAKLFSYLLPWLEFALRLNIFSALIGAATVSIVFLILQKLKIGVWAGLAAALSLAFGYTFWMHSGSIQVYGLTAFFFSSAVLFLFQYFETKKPRHLYSLAIVCGLGIGTHPTFLLFFPFVLVFFILKTIRGEIKNISIWPCLLSLVSCLLIVIAVYSYIPLRALKSPEINWGDPSTKETFINYITQRDYSEKIGDRSFESWGLMSKELGRLFSREFTWLGLALIIFGAIITFKKQRILFYSGLAVIILNIVLLGNYGNSQDIFILWRYFLPSYIIMAVFLAHALSVISASIPVIPAKAGIPLLLLPAIIFAFHFSDLNRRDNLLVPKTLQDALDAVPQNSIFITDGDVFFGGMIYEQRILGKRSDLAIIDNMMFTHPWYQEKKKKELEAKGLKYDDNIYFLIKNNLKQTGVYSLINSLPLIKMNFDVYPEGIVYEIKDKTDNGLDAAELESINDKLWSKYDTTFLQNIKFDDDQFEKDLVALYTGGLNNLAAYLYNHNYADASMEYFEKSLAIRENKNALYNLWGIYNALGDKTRAADYKRRFDALE